MNVITIDFETFYDRAFSLSKMTTEEYIRDELFEVIGVAVKVGDGETQWFSGPKAQTKRWLEQFDWANSIAVAHNAMFDMAILNWHFDIRPKRIADTLSMLRALDGPDAGNSLAKAAERYGLGVKGDEVVNALGKGRLDFTPEELHRYAQYCINDVDLTYDLFNRIAVGFPAVEFRLIDLTLRMFTEPVLTLDATILRDHLYEVQRKKNDLLGKALISKDNLMSNGQLAETLRDLGVEPPMKISPTTFEATNDLAWLLATCPDDSIRNPARALELSKLACGITEYKQWNTLDTYAAALAENGQYDEAKKWVATAKEMAPEKEKARIEGHMTLLGEQKPIRE